MRIAPSLAIILVAFGPAIAQVAQAPRAMVLVPGGSFTMGSDDQPDEKPAHPVVLDDYYIDRHEVTVAEFSKVMPHLALPALANHPVTSVTWQTASAYCRAVGKRLPTEAEWEKACRGIDARKYAWGSEYVDGAVNGAENGRGATAEVGSYPMGASPYGLLDMGGNVWEWTSDWFEPYPGSEFRSEETGEKVKVIRGGSWSVAGAVARCTNRFTSEPSLDAQDIGFRCARSR